MPNNEEQELLPSRRPTNDHRLESLREGESQVERLAAHMEARNENRIGIMFLVRTKLLVDCQKIAEEKGYPSKKTIRREDLVFLRDRWEKKVDNQRNDTLRFWLPSIFGIKSFQLYMLEALDRAILHFDTIDDDWFYYVEWTFYHTKLISKWPWMRNESVNALIVVVLFFLFTPILFCSIEDENICGGSGIGWMKGFYFASVTLSTVGYGDITVDDDHVNVGTAYMIGSICVSILAFSAAADQSFSVFDRFSKFDTKHVGEDQVLSIRLLVIGLWKIGEIVVQFAVLNMFGVIVSRFFQGNQSNIREGLRWTWGESIYWSVQSTTTIGYGDMTMSDEMRLFQVFYLCLGTFFVGNTLGKLANLKADLESMRRLYAWQQREVSKEMIRSDQGDAQDTNVDQWEFAVASLLNLGKISSDDLKPIMNKFRKLAKSEGDTGFIDLGDADS